MILRSIKMSNILQATYLNANSGMGTFEFQVKFHWNMPLEFYVIMGQHWFSWLPWCDPMMTQFTDAYMRQPASVSNWTVCTYASDLLTERACCDYFGQKDIFMTLRLYMYIVCLCWNKTSGALSISRGQLYSMKSWRTTQSAPVRFSRYRNALNTVLYFASL